MATPLPERRISQRELRNESGRIFRELREGHSFTLTNHGEPVGRLTPLDDSPLLDVTRPARRRGGWSELIMEHDGIAGSAKELLDEIREDRA